MAAVIARVKLEKLINPRHGHGGIRGKNAVEKAVETKERQFGKKEIRSQLID